MIVDADGDADLAFFARYGFVVYENVLSPEECAATRDEIFGELERVYGDASVQEDTAVSSSNVKRQTKHTVGFKRDDFKTYVALPIETYGLAPDPAVFTPRCVANRQNETVAKCLARVLRVADPSEDLLVSHDRWCVFRPTRDVPGVGDRPDWKTRANLHLDLNPWTYGAATETEATRMTRGADDETLSGRADALDAGTQFGEKNLETSAARDDDDAKPSSSSVAETLTFETLRDFSRETNCVEARTGPHCQGVLMLAENRAEDGGSRWFPGSTLCSKGGFATVYAATRADSPTRTTIGAARAWWRARAAPAASSSGTTTPRFKSARSGSPRAKGATSCGTSAWRTARRPTTRAERGSRSSSRVPEKQSLRRSPRASRRTRAPGNRKSRRGDPGGGVGAGEETVRAASE